MAKLNVLLYVLCALLWFSCKKQTEDMPSPHYSTASPKQAYEKKWTIVSSSSNRVSGTSAVATIQSIEFMLDVYVVVYSNDSTLTGSYTRSNSNTLLLNDFGTLTIVNVGDNLFDFVLSQSGKSDVTINAVPVSIVSNSAQTVLLCNTWKLKKSTEKSPIDTVITIFPTSDGENVFISLSQYGTYLQRNVSPLSADHIEHGTWQWSDANQNAFNINGNSTSRFDISFSSSNTHMTLSFSEPLPEGGIKNVLDECEIQ